MTADGGYSGSAGRRRPDRDPGDEEDYDPRAGYNDRSAGYQPGAGGYQAGGYAAGEYGNGSYAAGEYPNGEYGAGGNAAGGYGRPDEYQASDGYGRPDGYEQAPGYGEPDGYDRPAGYGGSGGYADPGYGESRYGDRAYGEPGYGEPGYGEPGYGDPGYGQGGYGEPGYDSAGGYGVTGGHGAPGGGYGGQADSDSAGGYDPPGRYPAPGGYPQPGGYGAQAGYGEPGYGQQGGYQGQADYDPRPSGRGRHSTGRASERADASSTDPYGGAGYGEEAGLDPYGTGPHQEPAYGSLDPPDQAAGHGSYYPNGQSRRAGGRRPAELGPGQDTGSTSSNPWPGEYGAAGTGPDSGPASPPDTDTGSHAGWAFRPDPGSYASGALGGQETGSFPEPDTGAFGRGESGTFARPDTGSFGRADSGAFPRAVPDSYGDDSAAIRRLDRGSFGADDEDEPGQPESKTHDSGTIRWMSGPPPAKPRTDRNRADLPERGDMATDQDGFAEWHDDPAGDDWPDDAPGGLLSRRFGRGGGGSGGGGDSGGGGGRSRTRVRKRRGARGRAAVTVAIFVVVLIVGIVAAVGYSFVNRWINSRYGDYSGPGTGTVKVAVPVGASLIGLGPLLVKDGVIMSIRPFDSAADKVSNPGALQPGIYSLHHHMNAALAVQLLLSPKARVAIKVRIPEGARAADIAKVLFASTKIPANTFIQLIKHPPSNLGLPSWAPAGSSAEGFLFPDTYDFTPNETALQILQQMVSDFNHRITPLNLVTEAAKVNTTPWHVLIMASMVQAESGPGDFGKVARVAWNRLGQGMALHFDSTVFYGLGIPVPPNAAATSKQVQKDTPYNTYIHTGLPPGPIGSPSLDAIKAALHPPHGPWLYFITDLRHKPYVSHFTARYSQFQQWQRTFQG